MRSLVCLLVAGMFLAPPALEARTIYVNPDGSADATTIAEGIAMAAYGDTVVVACGTYYESDIPIYTSLTLRSETGEPGCVTIDAQGESGIFLVEEAEVSLQGLTLTGGQTPQQYPGGAALLAGYAEISVSDCDFVGNEAPAEMGGGGAVLLYSCMARFERCRFFQNMGYWGGALACFSPCDVNLQDCEFRGNQGYGGGAVWAGDSPDGGAGAGGQASRNPAWVRGGGHSIDLSVFKGRGALRGVTQEGLSMSMTDCVLLENEAFGGGGCCCFFYYGEMESCSLERCLLARNRAKLGAAGYANGGRSSFSNCTIAENRSLEEASLEVPWGELLLDHTIIALNGPTEAVLTEEVYMEVSCTDIWGNQGGDWTGQIGGWYGEMGNISRPPIFCYMPNHRYYLAQNSPCLGAPDCGLIGAFGVGCPGRRVDMRDRVPSRMAGAPGAPEGVPSTWGVVKQLFE